MSESSRAVNESLIRRVEAAISSATVRRSAVEFDWPECHAKRCSHRHGDVDAAFGTMKYSIMQAVRGELMHEVTTRPDIAEDGDTPAQTAVYTLAHLMHTYRVSKTSTYVKAAQLIVDAYPALIPALGETSVQHDYRNRESRTQPLPEGRECVRLPALRTTPQPTPPATPQPPNPPRMGNTGANP